MANHKIVLSYRLIVSIVLVLWLSACAQRSVPAPVTVIDTTPPISADNRDLMFHEVQSGETLYGIAWLYGRDYQTLANINGLSEPYNILAGQKLKLSQKLLKQEDVKADNRDVVVTTPKPTSKNTVASKQTQVYRSNQDGKKSTVALTTLPPRVKRWVWPTTGNVVGKFSTAEAGNSGLLIANTIGTPVVSAAEGKVVYVGNALRGYGNLVIIKHTDNYLSAYAHNSKILVDERQFVKAGEMIAEMGNSGTTEAKLRFEIRFKGKSLDPLRFLPKQ
jgi:lipoprotein NlpD